MSIAFANGDSYQLVPWSGPTVASGNLTWAMRVFATATTLASDQQMAFLDTSGGATCVLFIDDHAGAGPRNWAAFVTNDAFTIFAQATDPSALTLNTWYHVAMTWDGTSTRLYVNGVLVNTNTPAATTRTGNWSNWGAPSNFQGSMQDVVTYNAALSVDEIKQLYRSRIPQRRANLVMHMPYITAPGLGNYSGVGNNVVYSGGGSPALGDETAGIPWGTPDSSVVIKKAAVNTAALAGNTLETGTMLAALAVSGNQLETGSALAVAGLAGGGVQTASMQAVASFLGATVQSAGETAVAQMLASILETGGMTATSSGGGGGSAATRNLTNPARRPLHILSRRGARR